MSLRCLMLIIICVVFITTEAVSGVEVKVFDKVGGTVSFGATSINPPVNSIIWKHRKNGESVIKAIEWDVDDGVFDLNPRFRDITTLDEKTGQITITKLNFEHSGLYTIDINSKEQEQRFKLEVLGEDVKKAVGDEIYFRPDKEQEQRFSLTVKGEEGNVFGEVGGRVSFRPTSLNPPVSSIIWKHRNGGYVVKAIEWDVDDGVFISNQRFRDITTLDEKTGQITITNLNAEHSGEYTIDINSKEQEQRFKLTVTGQEVKVFGALGGRVSFGPTSLNPPVSSIIWKHRSSTGPVVKAIEWDTDDGESIPHPRFKGITSLNRMTGQITITKLNIEHEGLYTIDINSKEQEQKYKLSLMDPVPKPEIEIDRSDKTSDFVYLICKYSETIIWNNSAGEILDVKDHLPKGKFITVHKNGHPDDYYTCTLKNEVSEKTSDPVLRRDLFEESGLWWIALIIIPILILALFVLLYKVWSRFHSKLSIVLFSFKIWVSCSYHVF
ncbi:uncharacterized protein LOC132143356 [Carassius carassius]|uniref:uncharacterized protein LOC132143356 n=1 Tax=Carassius carassius TaxID=217509 RepID=UPI0028692B34|nr:uncharacterized protein LOC132143356 [Carassius carassius]